MSLEAALFRKFVLPKPQAVGWLLSIMVALVTWHSSAADLGTNNCDCGLKPVGESDVAYANRGDRCEGIYVQEVSGGALEIVSLTESSPSYKFTSENPLRLEWPKVGDSETQIRARSLRRKLYYRMDTLRPPEITTYNWPSDILGRLELSRAEIGLLAWTEKGVFGINRRIYLPLRVTKQQSFSHDSSRQETQDISEAYKVVLLSDIELDEVYVTLRPVDRTGHLGNPVFSNRKLDQGYYPAERPIAFQLAFSELTNSEVGLYSLSVGAELRNSDPRIVPGMLFYHANSGKTRTPGNGDKP